MANEKISALPSAEAITGTEYVPIVQAGANRKATALQLKNYIAADVAVDEYPQVGEIYAKAGNFTSGDFTVLGGAAFTGGNLVLSGGVAKTDISKGVLLNAFEDSDNKVSASIRFVLNSTVGAITVGKESTVNRDWYWPGIGAQYDFADGKVKTLQTGNAPAVGIKETSEGSVTAIAGAVYDLFFSVNEWVLSAAVHRLDSGGNVVEAAYSVSEFQYLNQSYINSNTSKFAIYTHGGQQTVTRFNVSRQSQIGLCGVCADSKGVPVGATSYSIAWHKVVGAGLGLTFNCMAGNGDQIEDQIKNKPTIIAHKSPVVLFAAGRNGNVGGGTGTINNPAVMAALVQYDADLAAAGTTVLYIWNIPENAMPDQSNVGNKLNAAFPGRVFDASAFFDRPTMLNSDNESPAIHPNSLGQFCVGNNLLQNAEFRIAFARGLANYKLFWAQNNAS